MKKRLTPQQFKAATKNLDVGAQTIEIAYGVLVEGEPQSKFVQKFSLSRGAVSQAVNRVWAAHEVCSVPEGYEVVTALLPARQAFIVKRWACEAAKKIRQEHEDIDSSS
ncbi:TrfB-related DNA-binding protein [Pseudoduganella ginsengisoli]|uniref:Transcriptional regulator n=1 Tax=Pseudoduganella ginsengisoli TaxID=1462440 RepID=A0A6L6Q8B2_9BURK|nr:TrfB-related DNA-binding protein [Pseudoduganella ginsengisoli]MTW05860.1 transcriptional regulator [Pseudoduganella ginsengisoli]